MPTPEVWAKPPKVSLKQVYVEPFNFYKPYLTAIIIEIIHVHCKDSNSTIFVFNDIVCLFFDKLDIIITDPLISFCSISSFQSLKGPHPIIFFNCNKVKKKNQYNDKIKRQKISRRDCSNTFIVHDQDNDRIKRQKEEEKWFLLWWPNLKWQKIPIWKCNFFHLVAFSIKDHVRLVYFKSIIILKKNYNF